jgi:hypothetical protein
MTGRQDRPDKGQGVSNNESFIDEVTEEVRREKLYGYLRRYGWIGALAVVLIVGGAAWFEWQRSAAETRAQDLGDAMLTALESDDRVAALGTVTATGDAEAVRMLLLAAEQEAAGDAAAARATLEALAGTAGVDALYGDLARLKALMLAVDMDAAERMAGFEALSRPGAAYRMPALEQMALAQIGAGDSAAALETLAVIIEDAAVPAGMRARAEALVEALGGAAPAAVAE